jgi:hypothetical protein
VSKSQCSTDTAALTSHWCSLTPVALPMHAVLALNVHEHCPGRQYNAVQSDYKPKKSAQHSQLLNPQGCAADL